MSEITLCRVDEIEDGGALALAAALPAGNTDLVILRRGNQAWAYVNKCPHFSVGLDFEPGEFATYKGVVVMCAHHSALFRFDDGFCIEGPCEGASLTRVPIKMDGNKVIFDLSLDLPEKMGLYL